MGQPAALTGKLVACFWSISRQPLNRHGHASKQGRLADGDDFLWMHRNQATRVPQKEKLNAKSFRILANQGPGQQRTRWQSRNPISTRPSGRPATNFVAAWMPASTRTTSFSCCSSNMSRTNTVTATTSNRQSGSRKAQVSRTWLPSRAIPRSATGSTHRSSSRWSMPIPCSPARISRISTIPTSSARAATRSIAWNG